MPLARFTKTNEVAVKPTGAPVVFVLERKQIPASRDNLQNFASLESHMQIFFALPLRSVTGLFLAVAWFCSPPCLAASCTASPTIETRLRSDPSAETYTERGTWFNDRKQFGCAVEDFKKASQLNPGSARIAFLLGQSLYSSGNVEDAIDPLRQSARLDPKNIAPHIMLGEALDQLHRVTDAEIEWRAALAIDPKSTKALRSLSKDLLAEKDYAAEITLLRPMSRSVQLTPDLTLDLAVAYSQTGKLPDADELLRSALHSHPASLPLAEALAATLVLQARRQEAASVLATAIQHHPDDLHVQVLYLWIMVQQDEAEKARQLATKLLKVAPNNWEVLYLTGVVERRAGEYQAARGHLEEAVALNPSHVESRRNLGSVLAQLKDPQGAREQLQKAIDLGDEDPAVRFELASVLRTLGENQEADNQLKIYKQEAQEKSDLTQAYAKADFGDQKLAAGDIPAAIALYREALLANPRDASLAYKLAMACEKVGDSAGERAALDQAIQIDPNMAEAQNQLGYLDSRAGDTASAEEHFRLAVNASPNYAKAWVNLAATLYLQSKLPEAKEAVAHALQLEPGNPQALKLRGKLDTTQSQ
jgi:Flp pilus assembly protein TadD